MREGLYRAWVWLRVQLGKESQGPMYLTCVLEDEHTGPCRHSPLAQRTPHPRGHSVRIRSECSPLKYRNQGRGLFSPDSKIYIGHKFDHITLGLWMISITWDEI